MRTKMTRVWRQGGGLVASCVLLAAACGGTATAPDEPPRPNVVLIVVDTLRADHLSFGGYSRTTSPNLDRLAGMSVVFRNAFAAAPWTTPSMGSLFTSQYPSALASFEQPRPIGDRFPTLAEILKAEGYRTHGIISVSMLTRQLGFGRGFDGYDESACVERSEISSPRVTDLAIQFLKEHRDERFFLFVHYFDPHYNYMLHPEFDFTPAYDGSLGSGVPIQRLWQDRGQFTQNDVDYLKGLYDSEIRFTDHHIGRLLDEIESLGLFDGSVVVVTADHGEEFMERGWIGHTRTLHRELLHVPLIFRLPDGRVGAVDDPVGLVDVMPTILEQTGVSVPDGIEGVSLPLQEPFRAEARPIFAETSNPQVHQPGRVTPIDLTSMQIGDAKLIYDAIGNRVALFDVAADPEESTNLALEQRDRAERLRAVLQDWARRTEAKREGEADASVEELLSEEQLEELRALGYIQ
jgi:arylsulfatase A-like enzyme